MSTALNVIDKGLSIAGSVASLAGLATAFMFASKSSKELSSSITTVNEKINESFKDLKFSLPDMSMVGESITTGLEKGMEKGFEGIQQDMLVMANGLVKIFREAIDAHSPSRVFQRLGSYISEGLGDGISDGAKFATDAMEGMSDKVVDSSKALSKAGDGAEDFEKSMKKTGKSIDDVGKKKISFGGAFAIVAGVLTTIVGLFKNLMDSNEGFLTGTESTGGAMEVIMGIVSAASEFICGIISWISEFWAQNGASIMAGIEAIWVFLQPIVEGIKVFVGGLFEFIMGIFSGDTEAMSKGLSAMWEGIKQIFAPVIEFFSGIFAKAWEGIKKAFSAVGEFFSNVWATITGLFTTIGTAIGDAVSGAFKAVVNAIIGFAESTINGFIRGINGVIKLINAIPNVNLRLLSTLSIPRMEAGGLVSPGQFFIAREAGPELVGRIGSHTAVMNNNQIVESVKQGVYEAVTDALRGSGGGGSSVLHVHLDLDGREVTNTVIKNHNSIVKQTGASPLMV